MYTTSVTITHESERAHVHPEGGIEFCQWVHGIGWTANDEPTSCIQELALSARYVAFPFLRPLPLAELVAM